MASQILLSLVTGVVHSMRQPCVEMSITRTCALLRLPSRIVAERFSAARLERLRSGWPVGRVAESAMLSHPSRLLVRKEGEQIVRVYLTHASAWVAAIRVNMSVGAVLMVIPSSW